MMNKLMGAAALVGAWCAADGGTPARAGVLDFTWDPSQAVPDLGGGSEPFTADAITVKNFIRTTNTNNLTTLRQTFSGDQFRSITGFTLGGSSVAVPGLNSAFGLYFHINPAGSFPINSSGATIGPPTYSMLDVTLIADVGNDDGSLFSTPAGIVMRMFFSFTVNTWCLLNTLNTVARRVTPFAHSSLYEPLRSSCQ